MSSIMSSRAADLERRLAHDAEGVCRHYLPNGRRHGRYWLVGDVRNTPGRSLYVRLTGPESGLGAAGKWTDYVAPGIMLRRCAGWRCCARWAAFPQHNLSPSGRVA